jgi:hypothetical protein
VAAAGLDALAEERLRRAGWYPGRAVDITRYCTCWHSRGIRVNEPAESFCTEFGDLEIHHPPGIVIRGHEYTDFTRFDVKGAVEGISDEVIAAYSRIASEDLCPVGNNRSHMTVFVAPSGHLLAGVDNYLYILGRSSIEALNHICSGAVLEPLGEWHPKS